MSQQIDKAMAKRVAGVTLADLRTVEKVMRGETVRGTIGQRIQAAWDRLREKEARRA